MLINTDYFNPAELTGYARAALADQPQNRASLARWLPNRTVPDLDYRFTRGAGGLTEAAEYRTYDAESPIGARPGVSRVVGELPPISRKIRQSEYDRLRMRANPDGAIRDAVLNDAKSMTDQVAARVELARGDALVNGSVTITENGMTATVSFARDSGMAPTAATAWTTLASADVLGDALTWFQAYVDLNGEEPGAVVMSTTVLGLALRNTPLRSMGATLAGTPSILDRDTLGRIFTSNGLPPFYVVDERFMRNGAATRAIPANKFLFLPAPTNPNDENGTALGATPWGVTAESLEPEYGLAEGDQPGIVAGAYKDMDPVAYWTKAAGITMPILANPNLALCATVSA